jgi:hypothetical protein
MLAEINFCHIYIEAFNNFCFYRLLLAYFCMLLEALLIIIGGFGQKNALMGEVITYFVCLFVFLLK